jgi:glutamate synthase (NADPH/NADH) small chain
LARELLSMMFMGKVTGFLEFERETAHRRPVAERVNDWLEVYEPFGEEKVRRQAARCMDCGVPFCHNGCPVHNIIPDFNDLVYKGRWRDALRWLHTANNFPEVTGRICPAICEASCVLGIHEPPVAIRTIEREIVERGFAEGWIVPEPAQRKTGKKVAVVGSGPAGLAAAQQLARAGHSVTVFERNPRPGGLLRFGIPDFKLEKHLLDRRMSQMIEEGVEFRTNADVGGFIPAEELLAEFHAALITIGAGQPRNLNIPGRELRGIHFAVDYLSQQNRRLAGDPISPGAEIVATGKRVIVIGGGDTGADCLGTALRQKAASVQQFEVMPKPPEERSPSTPWPMWPLKLRTESAHEEGGERAWSISTTRFAGDQAGNVNRLHCVQVGPPPAFAPIAGTEFELEADLVLLAVGFLGPVRTGLVEQLGLGLDNRGNIAADAQYMTSRPGVFSAGDARRGQSLVVWAILEGREAARHVDHYLS